MAVTRDRPYAATQFLVDLGLSDPRSPAGGFSEVIFPTLHVPAAKDDPAIEANPHLVLRRGVTGALDLYAWWAKAARGKAPQRRSARIDLLDEAGEPVLSWRFRNLRPVSLTYSPLDANRGGVLTETIAFAFDGVDVS
jgi:phage tail-like protein